VNKKLLIIPVVLIGGATYALLSLRSRENTDPNRIRISGNIEMTEVNIAFKTAGKLIERTVTEGDTVTKGQLVARLDRDNLLRQRDREDAALSGARLQLAQTETALEWQRATVAADIEQRRADVTSQEARLAELKTGSRPEEKKEIRAAVEAAQTEFDRARRDWERAQVLYKNDDISTAQHDQYRARFDGAAAQVKQTKEREALVLAGPRREQIDAAAGQVERARAALRMAEANQIELKRRSQEVAARRADLERSRASLAFVDTQLADTVANSPVSGVVLVKSADVGEVIAPGGTIVTIGDVDHPWLRGYINETDLGRVRIGTKARVTTDSHTGKAYNGRVTFVASEAEFTPKQIQTQQERVKLVYRIKIEVEDPKHELKVNMPADAEIVVE
jgi:HlyD family secretion protein